MTAWQTSVELDPEPEPELEPEPTLAPSPARAVAAKRLSGKAKKAAAAAEKTRRNRRKQAPKLLVLVGLPGCGKSTFAKLLEASDPQWVHADSDVLRRDMESVVGRAAAGRNPKRVIVDKCNVEPRDRRPWPGLAHRPPVNDCMLVVFDVDVEECCKRVVARVGHPTIQAGHHNAAAIVRSFAKRWSVAQSLPLVGT
jgi:predicted kinase